jgi:hypothetical protein
MREREIFGTGTGQCKRACFGISRVRVLSFNAKELINWIINYDQFLEVLTGSSSVSCYTTYLRVHVSNLLQCLSSAVLLPCV